MSNVHTMTKHRDIQAWVANRQGKPAVVRAHDSLGHPHARLVLRFDHPGRRRGVPEIDQGASPVSWAAWLAELDRQRLALRVAGDGDGALDYELVDRRALN